LSKNMQFLMMDIPPGLTTDLSSFYQEPPIPPENTTDDLFRPTLQKTLVFEWYARSQIRKLVDLHSSEGGETVISDAARASKKTKQLANSILFQFRWIPEDMKNLKLLLQQKTVFCLGLDMMQKPGRVIGVRDYFEEGEIRKRLPFNTNNSCYCDSVIVALLYCNYPLLYLTLNSIEQYPYQNTHFQKVVRYLGISHENTLDLLEVEELDNYPIVAPGSTKSMLNATRQGFLNLITNRDTLSFGNGGPIEPNKIIKSIRDAYFDMKVKSLEDTYKYRMEDAGQFFADFMSYGYFYEVLGKAFLSVASISKRLNSNDIALTHDTDFRRNVSINLSQYPESVHTLQDLFDYDFYHWRDVREGVQQKMEILFPINFLAVEIVRESVNPNGFGYVRDKRYLIFENLSYLVNGKSYLLDLCAFVIKTGTPEYGHYTCYFKTDGGTNQWYYYDDIGKVLKKTDWNTMQTIQSPATQDLQNATLILLRPVIRPQTEIQIQ
jgi:hypothetical protein